MQRQIRNYLLRGGGRPHRPLYAQLASAVKGAAQKLGVAITWGGDWPSFPDGPHFELDRGKYP
ncbi:MAG: M15 family metallopeptidase [Roseomonas sp.]|nr:M15 family metallopeptidase [Roseomonas sp.]MCA3388328.1 M15 family metallopeptidase [Roseomonas sp.]MCA3393790.1 M15 family metallopeptidase [Roseomonas sp.]MCA3406647.1 M15 family metallopeptidase [Roseomonas sp.]